MKNLLISLTVLLLTCGVAGAQDWQTIRPKDTLFFAAGHHAITSTEAYSIMGYPYTAHFLSVPSVVRALYVTDTVLNPDGSVTFHFPKAVRDTSLNGSQNNSNCMDTAAASWLGKRMIRAVDGKEYYQNSKGDSILILTQAQPGDYWIIAHTSKGEKILAQVAYAGLTTIDGTTDSFKRVFLQAFSGTLPVTNAFNSMVLTWSKHHGWIKLVDFYLFPNSFRQYEYGGEFVDSTQHNRLPESFAGMQLSKDVQSLYSPGNAWIFQSSYIYNLEARHTFERDSVCSVQNVTADTLVADLAYYRYSDNIWGYSLDSGRRFDTVAITPVGMRFKELYFRNVSDVTQRFFVLDSPLCGNYLCSQEDLISCGGYGYFDSCMKITCLDGLYEIRKVWLPPFGLVNYYNGFGDLGDYLITNESWISYFRRGNCVWGERTYPKVGVGGQAFQKEWVQLFPLPADEAVQVRCLMFHNQSQFVLRNSLGQVVLQQILTQPETSITTTQLPAGYYFAEVRNKDLRWMGKVVVVH